MSILNNEGHDPDGLGNRPSYNEVSDLRSANKTLHALLSNRDAEIERLRAALKRIVDEADSDNGMTAWDGGDIAREALGQQTP